FAGQNPSGYVTSLTLQTQGSATWNVVSGSSEVSLTPGGNQATVTATGSPLSSSVGDVTITATVNGQTSNPFALTTLGPNEFQTPRTWSNECDDNFGYSSILEYTVLDNVTHELPQSVEYNERWTTSWTRDFSGTNWPALLGIHLRPFLEP